MMITFRTFMVATLLAVCPLIPAEDSVTQAAASGKPEVLIAALNAQGPEFRVAPELVQLLCDQPKMLRALLAWLEGDRSVPPARMRAENMAPPPPPVADKNDRSLQGDRLMVALDTLRRAEQKEGNERAAARYEAQNNLLGVIFDPENVMDSDSYAKAYGNDNLPDWVAGLMDQAVTAGTKGLPTLSFDVAKNLEFNATARELGVKVYVSLFMLHHLPDEVAEFRLRDELVGWHSDFPLVYDAVADDFQMTAIGKPGHNMLRLYQELGDVNLSLYPGVWGFRLRYTTGRDQLRSDKTYHFAVASGVNYKLEMKRGEKGSYVSMNLVPLQ